MNDTTKDAKESSELEDVSRAAIDVRDDYEDLCVTEAEHIRLVQNLANYKDVIEEITNGELVDVEVTDLDNRVKVEMTLKQRFLDLSVSDWNMKKLGFSQLKVYEFRPDEKARFKVKLPKVFWKVEMDNPEVTE